MPFIQVNDLCKFYGEGELQVKALDHVSFAAEKGEFIVVLGASGAGKTTLLNLLGGMDAPTSGSYEIAGKDIAKADYKALEDFRRNDIGFVFQFYNLMNNLTAYENVEIAASIVKNPLDPQEVLKEVGLEKRANNFPSQLSGGEQQRVSIARAVVKNPKLLLCDEPTGALDSKTGSSIIKLLYHISVARQTTVIIVTHNSNLANVATRLIRIADGKIIENKLQPVRADLDDIKW
ncbi:MAG: ABC transporter ATP-binding protein [Bacilli bacterium]|jgi:putative ABC transport system ATP-binding protein|nr:ABC transporter ATP-binding protein [Bacilli bacterium]